jgi:outer membrane protein
MWILIMLEKKSFVLTLFLAFLIQGSYSATLLEVYRDALQSDPIYQQALAQELSTAEGVPISLANLLPNAGVTVIPSLSRTVASGSAVNFSTLPDGSSVAGSSSARGYNVTLALTQTVFDLSKFANLAGAKEVAKQAQATLNSSTQELIIRVAKSYLSVLEDEDNLRSSLSTKKAFSKQLYQISEQYKVGLKTITDVYTARASYKNSEADYITAENTLANDKENLRAITSNLYPHLSTLSEKFPLISPQPTNIESWVATTEQQNWSIKSAEYAKVAAMDNIKQQRAGHFPTLNLEGDYIIDYSRTMGNPRAPTTGSSQLHTTAINMTLGIPIYQGGGVMAQTNKAKYDYQITSHKLEKQIRDATNLARQSYLGVIAGISKIQADRETIKSTQSSLEGMEAGYSVGTETLVNVLNQRQKVFEAQKQYAHDRYAYVSNLLTLKQAAGTLSVEDLAAINSWLAY